MKTKWRLIATNNWSEKHSLPFDGISNQHFNFIEINNNIELNSNNQAYFPLNILHFNYILDVILNLKNNSSNQFQSIYHLSIELDRTLESTFQFHWAKQ
jgi:hypothetical protein